MIILQAEIVIYFERRVDMQGYESPHTVCPFYKQEKGFKIRCEGFSKNCSLQTSFCNKDRLLMHKERYCNSIEGYMDCPLYPAIYGQYGEDDYR